MKYLSKLILLLSILSKTTSAFGQPNCSFPIDTIKILSNQNLETFLKDLRTDSFRITNDKKDIAEFIQKALDCYANGFVVANPNEPYQATDAVMKGSEGLPPRKLTFLAQSSNIVIIRYLIGGIGVSSHLVLIKFKDDKILDLWKGGYSGEIKTISDVINYLKAYRDKNLRRHENYVYF